MLNISTSTKRLIWAVHHRLTVLIDHCGLIHFKKWFYVRLLTNILLFMNEIPNSPIFKTKLHFKYFIKTNDVTILRTVSFKMKKKCIEKRSRMQVVSVTAEGRLLKYTFRLKIREFYLWVTHKQPIGTSVFVQNYS